jgi:hypothetical protein
MGYERVPTPVNIWEFEPRGRITSDDLVKIVYDNGSILYVAQSRGTWVVDSALMPNDLRTLLDRFYATYFQVMKVTAEVPRSGYVGFPLAVRACGDDMYYGNGRTFTSVPIVADISAARRPDDQAESLPAFIQ